MSVFFSLLFIFVPLIWLPNTSELFEFNKLILTYISTTLIVGSWAIRCIVEKRIIFRRTILDIPLLVFLGFEILSLGFSIDVHTSWLGYYSRWNGGLLSLISYSLLYWAFVSNMDKKSTLSLVTLSLVSAAIVAVYGSLEHFGASVSCLLTTGSFNVTCWVQDVQNRVFATLGQPNWLAAYIVALIFIPISKTLKKFSVPYFLISILLFLTLLFTKSRSALLAFGISSLVFWGTSLSNPPPKLGGGRKGVVLTIVLFIAVIGFLTFLIPNPLRDLVLKEKSSGLPAEASAKAGPALEVGGTESGKIRRIVWSGAIKIWQANPKNFLIGTGPETFAESYYQFRPVEHNQTSEWELLYNKAHNEFLNYLATTGLLGLLSYLLLLIIQFSVFIKKSPNTEYRLLNTALLAGWLTISITNFWGFSVVIMQLFLFLFPAIAIILNDQ